MRPPSIHDQLRQARLAKGWSQRALSERASLPQAHISRIESGAVDPKISTLQDLARLLDLELTLLPQNTLRAVEAVVRETTGESLRQEQRLIAHHMYQAATALQAMAGGLNDRVADIADDLVRLDLSAIPPWVRQQVLAAARTVDVAVKSRHAPDVDAAITLLRPILTDALDLATPGTMRPAYTLDDEA